MISGRVCKANLIELVANNMGTFGAAYGASRVDAVDECGDANNCFDLFLIGICQGLIAVRSTLWPMARSLVMRQ